MAHPVALPVKIVGIHICCGLCGAIACVMTGELMPGVTLSEAAAAWWEPHRQPLLMGVDVNVGGVPRYWGRR